MLPFYPLVLKLNFHEIVRGGHLIKPMKGLSRDGMRISEGLEVSAIPKKESAVVGMLKGAACYA